jgi:hypothetical protein
MSIPYQDLYIYEVSGEVTDSRLFFQKDFIGCWNEGDMSCLFFSAPHDDAVYAFIQKKGFRLLSRNVMDYRSWQAGEELKSFKIGNLVFSPPWEREQAEEGETLVYLDPCVVFGTGHHPTTRSCLKGLWEIYQQETPKRVLDLGTGSGVLALAAAKWGAERVLAVDCNELAVDTARRNVHRRGGRPALCESSSSAPGDLSPQTGIFPEGVDRPFRAFHKGWGKVGTGVKPKIDPNLSKAAGEELVDPGGSKGVVKIRLT